MLAGLRERGGEGGHEARDEHGVGVGAPDDEAVDRIGGRAAEGDGQALGHHDALRLHFPDSGRDAFIPPPDDPDEAEWLLCHDLRTVPTDQQPDEIERLATTVQQSLDPARGQLLRAMLFDAGPTAPGRLLIVVHHLVVDGVSWPILLEDLSSCYRQLSAGTALQLPAKTTSFQAWARRLAAHASSDALATEQAWWEATGQGPIARLPVDHPHGDNRVVHSSELVTTLTAADTRMLLQDMPGFARDLGDADIAALSTWLRGYYGGSSVPVEAEAVRELRHAGSSE